MQAPDGIFVHLQDPNKDYLEDSELKKRIARLSRRPLPAWVYRFWPARIAGRLRRELSGTQGQDYLSKTNRALLEKGYITSPLSAAEIFAITDIQAHDGEGVSMSRMKAYMPDYECVSQRSYSFFGQLSSVLPSQYRALEEDLTKQQALNGNEFGCVWKLRSPR